MLFQPLIDAINISTGGGGWLELPDSYGAALWGVSKGAGHRYIKRVPKPGGGYRYFYHVGHGGGVLSEDHFVPGASFKFDGGHYHIKSEEGGKLTIEHDETKERKTVSKSELRTMLGAHHEPAIKAHREKVAGMLADARANKASPKQIARLEARAKSAGASMDDPVPKSKNPLLQPGTVVHARGDSYVGETDGSTWIVAGMDGDRVMLEFLRADGRTNKRSMPSEDFIQNYKAVPPVKGARAN